MERKKLRLAVLGMALVMLSFSSCGKAGSEEAAAPSVQESGPEDTAAQTPEPEPAKTYVEEHGIEFCSNTAVEARGLAMNEEDLSDYIYTDALFQLDSITIEDADTEGYKTVIVEHSARGYSWTDGREYKLYVRFPAAVVADTYTGLILPYESANGDRVTEEYNADIEWNGKAYHISYQEESSWDHGTAWEQAEDGSFIWKCGVYGTLTITIPEDYDGLALFLPPVLVENEPNEPDKYILDYWSDEDCFLFKIDISENVADIISDAVTDKNGTDKDEAATPASRQEGAKTQAVKQEEAKPVHTHSYAENVTVNPACGSAGTKVFTCSCGDSYSENIPATGNHTWVERTETVHHESTGHMESTPREVNTFHCDDCGNDFDGLDAYMNHNCSGNGGGSFSWTTETVYDNVWVVDSEAYDSEEVVGYTCSVCGAEK